MKRNEEICFSLSPLSSSSILTYIYFFLLLALLLLFFLTIVYRSFSSSHLTHLSKIDFIFALGRFLGGKDNEDIN